MAKAEKKATKSAKVEKKSKGKEKDVKAKKGDKEVKAKKSEKEMTPLEKARLARASGKGGKSKAKKAKKALPTWKAPEDFKPHFMAIMLKTDKDGLLSNSIKATRYQGRYDPDADDKKKFDVATYDQATVLGILSRFSMVTFVTNAEKRIPANTVFQILLRINKKKEGELAVLFKGMEQVVTSAKTGKKKLQALDKKDPTYRKFRKAVRILPAAFKTVLMPPKRTRGANKKQDDE